MAGNDYWQNMVDAARNKTAEIADFVRNDLNELSSAVGSEVLRCSDAMKRGASSLIDNVKGSLNLNNASFSQSDKNPVRSLVKSLWKPETVQDDDSPMIIRDSEPVPMTEVQYRHHVLVTDPKNFTEGFSEEEERLAKDWYATAGENLQDVEYIGKQLSECPALADMYRRLVPDQVTHSLFWKRYLFRRDALFNCYTEEDVGSYQITMNDRILTGEDIGSFKDHLLEEPVNNSEDEPTAIQIVGSYGSSSKEIENNWDDEFNIDPIKETDDITLSDIISAD